MLILARNIRELNFSKLMDVYIEGNMENADELWPELPDGEKVLRAEQEFYQYLTDVFFRTPGAVYVIWEEQGKYISALRLEPYRDGLLLEALETAPTYRRQGYAEKLMLAARRHFCGTTIYSHVSKRNLPSLRVHQKCGFHRILEYAVYIDGSVNQRCCTLRCDN